MSVKLKNIGILSPGDMGHAVGQTLIEQDFAVLAALNGRSERTRELATGAGITNVGSIDQLVKQCDVILSILVPSAALTAAQQVAGAMRATGAKPLYVDCNAVAPQTVKQAGEVISAAGGSFVDGSILGSPPHAQRSTRLYLSGPDADKLRKLETSRLKIKVLSRDIGDASALKMCYAAFSKGITALATELLVAADRLGVEQNLRAELEESHGPTYEWLLRGLPVMPPKAHRWIREMEEIALTFESLGMTPKLFHGVADVYRWIADTKLGRETPEERDPKVTGADIIKRLAKD